MEIKTSYLSFLFNYILIALGFIVLILIYLSFGNPFTSFNTITLISLAIIFGLFLLVDEIIYKRLYTYEIGEKGVLERFKFLSKREKFISYQNVSEINLNKTLLDRILNIGSIEVVATTGKIVMRGIRNPEKIYQEIVSRSNKEKE